MKLKFEKNKEGEVSVKINGKDFSTADYIEMIKKIKDKKEIKAEFDENISEEDKKSINLMLMEINNIGKKNNLENGEDDEEEEQINTADIPF